MRLIRNVISADPKTRTYIFAGLFLAYLLLIVAPAFAQDVTEAEYRPFPKIGSRNAAWIAAQFTPTVRFFYLGRTDVRCRH